MAKTDDIRKRSLLSRLKQGKPIIGMKKNGRRGVLNAAERAELEMELGIFYTDDIRKIPKKAQQDLKVLVREKKKEIEKEYGIEAPDIDSGDVYDLFNTYMEYTSIDNDYRLERQRRAIAEEGGEDAEIAEDDDKWRLIRKLAETDKELNINRAYASDTLHAIERIIEEGKYTFDEIYDKMQERAGEILEEAKAREDTLTSFWDDKMVAGFHGEDRAVRDMMRGF